MKQNGTQSAVLSPDAHGWRVSVAGGVERTMPSLAEAVAGLPANAKLELGLPCQAVVIERHKLPSTDRAELAGMLQLQLEKTLPFPVDDVTHGFEILDQSGNESTVLTVAAPFAQLERLCAPLREKGCMPQRITLHALRVAAACPAGETVLALWPEQEQTVAAIITDGKLAWAQPIAGLSAESVIAELPGLLLGAELEGVPSDFSSIQIAEGCSELTAPLTEHFGKPVNQMGAVPASKGSMDLLPASWEAEARRRERRGRLKQRLVIASVLYLVLVAGAFIYLTWLQMQVNDATDEYKKMEPRFSGIKQQMARWESLAPAVERERSLVEVLHQATKTWQGNDSLQFTQFNFSPTEWVLKGEATIDARFDFVQRLKNNKELERFVLKFEPEQPLKNDRFTLVVTGGSH